MNPWYIEESEFDPENLHSRETVYTIGNGYFGTRGTFEEGYPKATPATLLSGVFDKIAIGKEELANVPDWLVIKLFVNGERFRLDQGKILDYQRTLDMQQGILRRIVRWVSPGGIRIRIMSERIASLADEHVGAIRYSLTVEELPDADGKLDVLLLSDFNTAVGNNDLLHWETVEQRLDGEVLWLHSQTRHSAVQLIQTMSFTSKDCEFQKDLIRSDIAPGIHIYKKLAVGDTMTAEKVVVMYTSRDTDDPLRAALEHHHQILQLSASPGESDKHYTLLVEGTRQVKPCIQVDPFETLLAEHKKAWQNYWRVSDVIIEGDDIAQQAVRYNIYQLRISAPAHDSRYSIAAKGLTGFGYHGHIFHDTEIFMLPYFTYVHPDIARNLLMYRYRFLPAARVKAKSNGYEGAQYPWESASDGEETTPPSIIHPESGELIAVLNGQLELHITACISHGAWQYWRFTGDDEFMREYGAEILLSTAAFWANRVTWNSEQNAYEINNVVGPDEWHEHVNNNAYTNYMARWNIQTAIDVLNWLQSIAPDKAQQLALQLDLNDQHLADWHNVVDRMRIPLDKHAGLFEQFDGFFQLEPFDQEKYKGRSASFQGILGMEPVQRYQIIKQADVLMLLTVMSDEFDLKTKKVNWDYYFPITDHDYGSSLTPAFHVILACELDLVDIAYKMFMKGALVDLEDQRGNSDGGIHDACAGAVWQAMILGFAGLLFTEDGYTTTPRWPDGWTRLAFTCFHKGKQISIDLRRS